MDTHIFLCVCLCESVSVLVIFTTQIVSHTCRKSEISSLSFLFFSFIIIYYCFFFFSIVNNLNFTDFFSSGLVIECYFDFTLNSFFMVCFGFDLSRVSAKYFFCNRKRTGIL